MEMATALLSMVGLGGAGAAGAISATLPMAGGTLGTAGAISTALPMAGGTLATAASGGSLMQSILQGTLTAFSAASSIGQGIAARDAARMEELGAAAQASRDKIAADDEAMRINRALAEVIGEQSVAYAAAGIELGSGTPVQARQEARRRANEDLNINRSNRNAKVAQWNQRALAARSRGQNAFLTGLMNAGADLASYGLNLVNRGGPMQPRRA